MLFGSSGGAWETEPHAASPAALEEAAGRQTFRVTKPALTITKPTAFGKARFARDGGRSHHGMGSQCVALAGGVAIDP